MNGQQPERCDRTAYVSGLQPTISDIELFEVFNRVAHVEKVIVRNGAVRHALVVFKTVQGLYMVLIHFQGTYLHGRQLHIRPLRESSHANSETITTMFEKAKCHGQIQNRRPASVQERPSPTPYYHSAENCNNNYNRNNNRGHRNSSGSYGRRREAYRGFQNDKFAAQNQVPLFDGHQMFPALGNDNFQFDDYAEGAKRFDNLANLIRASTPTDPFANYQKCSDSNKSDSRPRAGSARDHHSSSTSMKTGPPTWKMELQIKKTESDESWRAKDQPPTPLAHVSDVPMSPQKFLAQIAQAEQMAAGDQKKKRPNLSVINPLLFYDLYPRTSSPVTFAPPTHGQGDRAIPSPHDPAVLAYSRMRVPHSAFAGLSPIDTNNCSFITRHLGVTNDRTNAVNVPTNVTNIRRDMTNEELSDMIVSTGNLRLDPAVGNPCNQFDHSHLADEPAPWSPVKRLRAESGCQSSAQFASPQFSPIKSKSVEFNETEDDVFCSENRQPTGPIVPPEHESKQLGIHNVLVEQKNMPNNYEDINNSRLPSNSHSANPSSDKKAFIFPLQDYPLCRHSSVPSLAHLVGDMSDGHFGSLDPHVTAGGKLAFDHSSFLREYQSTSAGKIEDPQLDLVGL
uniref:RRM domain-containing protein n=1 Tax=Caenorhabditis japonica TaxID=281687 RepID=A0A8R1HKA8_CAEJA